MSEGEPRPAVDRDARARKDDGGVPLGLILVALLALYAVVFVALNLDEVKINFVFFSARISLFVAILLLLGIGFAGGYVAHGLRLRRRAGPSQTSQTG